MKVLYLKDNYDILLKITVSDACSRMFTGPYAGFFIRGGSKVYMPKKVPNIRRIINDILKIVNIVFSRGQLPPPVSPLCTVLNV